MAVTIESALAFVGAQSTDEGDVQRALDVAAALVTGYLDARTVPDVVLEQAVLEVTATVFRRRGQPGGQAANTLNLVDGVVVREPSDPRTVARGILDPFLLRGLA